ncbi:C4-dicarboxylic acid transporter DauA [Myxococcaceae bacterium]|jgi:SulP family sulfate permease|nr:C4-dicarboxylic acid transporter DauA [Myxococcaceae bacterium]
MPRTRRISSAAGEPKKLPAPAAALRHVLAAGYGAADLRADLLAGAVVGIVALPLAMALAIASGVPPQHGLYTAIIAGGAIALLGGSRFQVSGPTAAFVVLLAPVSAQFGVGGLLVATVMAGALLLALGAVRMGGLIQFVPHPVTTGFTAGIAVVIATLQVKDFAGLSIPTAPEHYVERVTALVAALPTLDLRELTIGSTTLAILLVWPRFVRAIPAPLVALALGAGLAFALQQIFPDFEPATIQSRFSFEVGGVTERGIPSLPPLLSWPWSWPGADGRPLELSFGLLRDLAPSAFAIAMLGAIESLLSAVVADGMTGTQHDPDTELIAQGFGNLLAPFFGGIAATGAIARTATNIRYGARSPLAAFFHAVFVLVAVLAAAPLLGYLPMASLAALLLLVAWNMSDARHFVHACRVAPKSDVIVLLVCFGLTVIFDMVIAVSVGIVLAALLFMRRMAELSSVTLVGKGHAAISPPLPSGVLLYDIAGPLFFGAAQRAMEALSQVAEGVRVVLLDVRDVPAMDATGLVNLESALSRLHRAGTMVILGGLQPQPAQVLERAGIESEDGKLVLCESFDDAIALARLLLPAARAGAPTATPAGGA